MSHPRHQHKSILAAETVFAVRANAPRGERMTLRRFSTEAAAQAHAATVGAPWSDVDVEMLPAAPERDTSFPPKPWTAERHWSGNWYLLDANGKRFLTLLGTEERREQVVEHLCGIGAA